MKKRRKKRILIFMTAGLLMMPVVCSGCGMEKPVDVQQDQTEQQVAENGETVETQITPQAKPTREPEKYQFPLLLDSERLELNSVFGYTGLNPDCEDVYGEEIGAIHLKNVSGSYLQSAQLQVTLSNGDVLEFMVEDVPADMEVMAFDLQNVVYNDFYRVENIQVQTEYGETDAQELFSWSVSGSEITVENISDKQLNNITLYYHCTIDGLTYGGKSYEQQLDTLQPGESAAVSDTFCYVGDVTVVNVTHK